MATDAEKAAKAEADRRAKLTPEQREAEDKLARDQADEAELAKMEDEERAKNAADATGGGARPDRAALAAKVAEANKSKRAKEATVEGIVARGRTLFTEAGQTIPHKAGDKIMLTPAEHAQLSAAGHLVVDGNIVEPEGPQVYREAGLLVGHSPGQGQPAK